jgi:hypothetical protein
MGCQRSMLCFPVCALLPCVFPLQAQAEFPENHNITVGMEAVAHDTRRGPWHRSSGSARNRLS